MNKELEAIWKKRGLLKEEPVEPEKEKVNEEIEALKARSNKFEEARKVLQQSMASKNPTPSASKQPQKEKIQATMDHEEFEARRKRLQAMFGGGKPKAQEPTPQTNKPYGSNLPPPPSGLPPPSSFPSTLPPPPTGLPPPSSFPSSLPPPPTGLPPPSSLPSSLPPPPSGLPPPSSLPSSLPPPPSGLPQPSSLPPPPSGLPQPSSQPSNLPKPPSSLPPPPSGLSPTSNLAPTAVSPSSSPSNLSPPPSKLSPPPSSIVPPSGLQSPELSKPSVTPSTLPPPPSKSPSTEKQTVKETPLTPKDILNVARNVTLVAQSTKPEERVSKQMPTDPVQLQIQRMKLQSQSSISYHLFGFSFKSYFLNRLSFPKADTLQQLDLCHSDINKFYPTIQNGHRKGPKAQVKVAYFDRQADIMSELAHFISSRNNTDIAEASKENSIALKHKVQGKPVKSPFLDKSASSIEKLRDLKLPHEYNVRFNEIWFEKCNLKLNAIILEHGQKRNYAECERLDSMQKELQEKVNRLSEFKGDERNLQTAKVNAYIKQVLSNL